MNRTTLGYFLMAVFAGGILWGILRVGSRLKAPPDLSGKWQVIDATPPREVEIQQSGVYFHIRVDAGPTKPYKLEHARGGYWLIADDELQDTLAVSYEADGSGKSLTLLDTAYDHPALALRQAAPNPHGSH